MTITRKLGKAAPDHTKAAVLLADHLTGTPAAPAKVDWLSQVTSWPMFANDRLGDCVWAMIGHALEAWTQYAAGSALMVPEQSLLKGYHDVTGWVSSDPNTDQGTVMQDAMNYWRKTGILDATGKAHKILAFAKVNHQDLNELKLAVDIFGTLLVGIQFPNIAMDQFNAGQPWSVVRNDGGIEGGHAIHVGAYDSATFDLITWGKVQPMTAAFAAKYIDEAWVAITPEWLAANGQAPSGVDLHGLGQALSDLTGEPNPFPNNPPQPPQPPVAYPDETFAAVLHPWLAKRHFGSCKVIADAAKAWLSVRGL